MAICSRSCSSSLTISSIRLHRCMDTVPALFTTWPSSIPISFQMRYNLSSASSSLLVTSSFTFFLLFTGKGETIKFGCRQHEKANKVIKYLGMEQSVIRFMRDSGFLSPPFQFLWNSCSSLSLFQSLQGYVCVYMCMCVSLLLFTFYLHDRFVYLHALESYKLQAYTTETNKIIMNPITLHCYIYQLSLPKLFSQTQHHAVRYIVLVHNKIIIYTDI